MVGSLKYLLSTLFIAAHLTVFSQEERTTDSLDSILAAVDTVKLTEVDSISRQLDQLSQQQVTNPKLDSLENYYKQKADSLQAINLPHQKYLDNIDSLGKLPERKINEKIQQWQTQGEEKLDDWTGKANDELSEKLPDTDVSGIGNNKLTNKLSTELELPVDDKEQSLSEELEIDNKLNTDFLKDETQIGEIKQEVDEIKEVPTGALEDVKQKTGVDEISGDIKKYTEEAGEVSERVTQIKNGDMTEVENKIGEKATQQFEEVGALNEQKELLEQTRAEHEEYLKLQKDYMERAQQYSDPEFVKQRIMEKSKYIANDMLAEYQSKVKEAQEELTQIKIDTTDKIIHVPDAQEWPLRDRVVAGVNLELMRDELTQLDLAPYIGFQMNDHWHLYGSYLYRIDFNRDQQQMNLDNPVYGPRIATTYRFYKGFYFRISGDQLSTYVS